MAAVKVEASAVCEGETEDSVCALEATAEGATEAAMEALWRKRWMMAVRNGQQMSWQWKRWQWVAHRWWLAFPLRQWHP